MGLLSRFSRDPVRFSKLFSSQQNKNNFFFYSLRGFQMFIPKGKSLFLVRSFSSQSLRSKLIILIIFINNNYTSCNFNISCILYLWLWSRSKSSSQSKRSKIIYIIKMTFLFISTTSEMNKNILLEFPSFSLL